MTHTQPITIQDETQHEEGSTTPPTCLDTNGAVLLQGTEFAAFASSSNLVSEQGQSLIRHMEPTMCTSLHHSMEFAHRQPILEVLMRPWQTHTHRGLSHGGRHGIPKTVRRTSNTYHACFNLQVASATPTLTHAPALAQSGYTK